MWMLSKNIKPHIIKIKPPEDKSQGVMQRQLVIFLFLFQKNKETF